MAADTNGMMCLLRAMDSLWFHKIILCSEKSLFLQPETTATVSLSLPKTELVSSRNSSRMSLISQQENSPVTSDETSSNGEEKTSRYKKMPTRPQLNPSKARCHSSSPKSAKNKSRKLRYSSYYYPIRLQKTRSCKTLTELELEEVKGFTDLGFTFRKELFTNRLIKLIPGLQRIDAHQAVDKSSQENIEFTGHTHFSEDDEKNGVIRPYLSEAWFTEKRDSPLLKFRTPQSATAPASEMKKQLKDWARTVALIIQQEP